MNEQELREAERIFTVLTGDPAAGAAAARKGVVLSESELAPPAPPEARSGISATPEFVQKTIAAAIHPAAAPLPLKESEANAADVFTRLTGSREAGEAAARRQQR